MADPLIFTAVGNHETGYEGVVTKVACGHRHQTTTEARACIRATLDAERATVPTKDNGERQTYRDSGIANDRCSACGFGLYAHECPVAERATVPAPKCCFKTHGIAGDCPLRATVPAPVTPDLRAAAQAVYDIVTEYVEWNDPAWVAQLDALRAALSDRDAEPVSRDALRLDPEDPESVERLARALLPGHDFMHDGDQDTCSERDMPAAMEAAERIARAFAAPDPTEETR